jgi:hypothetical protein
MFSAASLEQQLNKLDVQGDNVEKVRNRIQVIEAHASKIYIKEYFKK